MLRRKTVALCCAVLMLAGCGSAGTVDKAGGAVKAEPVVLTMANTRGAWEVEAFMAEVTRLSGGSVRIEATHEWHTDSPSAEADLVREVRAGKFGLGVVGARVWHGLGVPSFDALLAPLEIGDLAQEQAVLGDTALTSAMLQGPAAMGLEGVGILPGPVRQPAGTQRRLLGPADYKGAEIAFSASEVAARSLTALGAKPVSFVFEGAPVDRFDGAELQISAVWGNQYDTVLRSLTADVGLWPRPLTVVANGDALTPDQRDLLRRAAAAALPKTVESVRSFEQEAIGVLCRRNAIKLVTAGPDRVRELRAAFAPVYAWLEKDRQTRDLLARVRAVRDRTPVESAPTCSASTLAKATPPATRSPIDGVFKINTTLEELSTSPLLGDAGEINDGNWGELTLTFSGGQIELAQRNERETSGLSGTSTLEGDILTMRLFNGELFTVRWSLYKDTLTFKRVPDGIGPTWLVMKPWRRTGDA